MKATKNKLTENEFQDVENDALWNLLDHGSQPAASPTFLQNTLREARIQGQNKTAWWKQNIIPKFLVGSAVATCAIVVAFNFMSPQTISAPGLAQQPPAKETENPLEEALAHELLAAASTDPDLLTDGEILELLF